MYFREAFGGKMVYVATRSTLRSMEETLGITLVNMCRAHERDSYMSIPSYSYCETIWKPKYCVEAYPYGLCAGLCIWICTHRLVHMEGWSGSRLHNRPGLHNKPGVAKVCRLIVQP